MIHEEVVDSLTMSELQDACNSRGMGVYGLNENRLKQQLIQWLDLSLNKRVPPLLLLLSRGFSFSPNIPTSDLLKESNPEFWQHVYGHGIIDDDAKLKAGKEDIFVLTIVIYLFMLKGFPQRNAIGKAYDNITYNLVDKAVLTDKIEIEVPPLLILFSRACGGFGCIF